MTKTDLILVKKYELLEDFQKRIVQLFALASEPLDVTKVFKMLQQLRIHPRGASLNAKDVTSHIFLLLNKSVLAPATGNQYVINNLILNQVVRELHKDILFNNYTETLNQFLPLDIYSYWQTPPLERYYANIRIALLKRNTALVNSLVTSAVYKHKDFLLNNAFNILLTPFDEKWLLTIPDSIIHAIFMNAVDDLMQNFNLNKELFDFVEKHKLNTKNEQQDNFRDGIKWRYITEGNSEKLKSLIYTEPLEISRSTSFRGALDFYKGNYNTTKLIDDTHKAYRKEQRKRTAYAPYASLQYIYLAYLSKSTSENNEIIFKYLKSIKGDYRYLSNTLLALASAQKNEMNIVQQIFKIGQDPGIGFIFINYAKYWIYRKDAKIDYLKLEAFYDIAEQNGLIYIQLLINDLLIKFYENTNAIIANNLTKRQQTLQKQTDFVSIIELMPKVEPWERAISALIELSNQFEKADTSISPYNKRLIWLINFKNETLEAKEQKVGKTGKWTKGKSLSHERMHSIMNYDDENYFTTQDQQVANAISNASHYGYSTFHLNENIIKALVDHPNLYLDNAQRTSVEITLQQPQLVVERNGEDYELRFDTPIDMTGIKLVKETPTRYKAVEITDQHLRIANAIGDDKVIIPKSSEEQIAQIVKGFSKVVNVQSELLTNHDDVVNLEANPIPHLHLLPAGDGFELEMYVKPFGLHPPYFKPADGGKVLLTEHEGIRYQTERDLDLEQKLAKEIVKHCPSLGNARNLKKIWEFETPEQCLEILTELQPFKEEEKIILEWPKGERLKLKGMVSMGNFSMNIKESTNWFEANGTLKVGEDLVLNMKEVLGLLNNNESRFIKLKNGEFLALTNRFKKQLQAIESYGDVTKDGTVRFHPLAAYAINGIADEAEQLETDSAFKAQIQKLKDAEKKVTKLPSTFKAELRSYQTEGYNWLMKLANWEVGACLADDMGLGKTVQALAAILTRATLGPTLVVCPASVRTNWEREALKFAPTLNPIQFGEGDRKQILEDLKPFDVLVTSYGLMQTESENLKEVQFSTIVLDEAQAIKNKSAKRSKAAMELQAGFKILTTGTPIENHLGELWNLFRFINPGLLGSMERFKERFAVPISKGDDISREQLKKLIRPFILRRRKSEVLLELPEKTEIVLTVTLSPAEKAFYEALRQSAMEKLEDLKPKQGSSHLQILAEITRLRQACCNPKLVKKSSAIKSSKMALFNETIDELLDNGHKVLVFSQFVQHLKLLEASLKRKKISYQYLDGSTSTKNRQIAIDKFQGGEGDVFLISLKAGGVGLNLTAADYVIHMDPWWNPAVEDQASDRAHRIGQKRPVTIYRLVTEGTIEEKIVQLHGQKRDLADSLLSGTNSGNKMTANDLMNLIKEGLQS